MFGVVAAGSWPLRGETANFFVPGCLVNCSVTQCITQHRQLEVTMLTCASVRVGIDQSDDRAVARATAAANSWYVSALEHSHR